MPDEFQDDGVPAARKESRGAETNQGCSAIGSEIMGSERTEKEVRLLTYLVRLGVHGQVGRLRSVFGTQLRRDQAVLCRTNRGLELGVVLAESETRFDSESYSVEFDGQIVRLAAAEDLYLQKQLKQLAEQFTPRAVEAFWLVDRDSVLLDVEPMLDSQTVYFHFLGPVAEGMQKTAAELANEFQQVVAESRVAQLLETGCGPGCGTTRGGCGTKESGGGCSGCAVSRACATKSM